MLATRGAPNVLTCDNGRFALMVSPDPNPARAEPGWPAVVVASAHQTGVGLMRNLVRRGVTVCCVDHDLAQPGFRTVYGKAHRCPNPDEKPAEWAEFMVALAAKTGGKPALICCSDQFVTAVAAHAGRLKESFLFCHTTIATQALLSTKQRQYEIAEAHGVPVPRTRFVKSVEEAMAFGAGALFPCVLKPVQFREWERFPAGHPLSGRKVIMVPSLDRLEATYHMAAEASSELVVQEIIEGPDTAKLVYLSCYDQGGKRIGACMMRELRTFPIHFGSASMVEPVTDPETNEVCDRFLRSLGYVGLCEIELKGDTRDGRVKMIEANPRYTGTSDSTPYGGVDLGWLHYLDLIGKTVVPTGPSPRSFRHVMLYFDICTIGAYRREKLVTWREVLWSYRPPLAFYDFHWRDWRNAAHTVYRVARFLAGRLARLIFRQRVS